MPVVAEVETMLSDLSKFMPADQIASLRTQLDSNTQAQDYFKGGLLRQSDYSKQADKLRKDQELRETEIAKKESEAVDLRIALEEWKSKADVSMVAKDRKMEQLESKLAKVNSRIGSLKDTYAIADEDLKDLFEGEVVNTEKKLDAANHNYITKEDFQNEATTFAKIFPKLSLELDDIRDEHKDLYGKRLSKVEAETILDKAYASGGRISVRSAWEEQFKVSDRRTEISKKDEDDRVNRRVDEQLKIKMSELNISGGGNRDDARQGSPVFKIKRDEQTEGSKQYRDQSSYVRPDSTVSKAVSAYREGKYKNAA